MRYKEVIFTLTSNEDFHCDLLINELAEAGFDTFEEVDSGFKAYILENAYEEAKLRRLISDFVDSYGVQVSFSTNEIAPKNWNEVWESNFSPITVAGKCYIRATFHEPRPQYPFEIVIDPKMAFGTGHHHTTAMMMELMLDEDFKGKAVLDMGCGTGILAILAKKLHAKEIIAIDYDPVCFESTLENAKLNNAEQIKVICGSKEVIPTKNFDFVLANINRNILLDQIRRYAEVLADKGVLLISGFYQEDLPTLVAEAEQYNLICINSKNSANWVAAKFLIRK